MWAWRCWWTWIWTCKLHFLLKSQEPSSSIWEGIFQFLASNYTTQHNTTHAQCTQLYLHMHTHILLYPHIHTHASTVLSLTHTKLYTHMHTYTLSCTLSYIHYSQKHTHFYPHICTLTCMLTCIHTLLCAHTYACIVICTVTYTLHSDLYLHTLHVPSLTPLHTSIPTCIPIHTHLHLGPCTHEHTAALTQVNVCVELHTYCMPQGKTYMA